MDTEDKTQLSDAEEVAAMLNTRGWQVVKAQLDLEILDLQNINNIDTSDPATMQIEIRARVLAYKMLWGFLQQHVYGLVEQQRASQERLVETSSSYIERHPA